jgi:hypothetical protein
MDNATFEAVLCGRTAMPGQDADWAMLRLIEYAPYRGIRRLLPQDAFLSRWPSLMPRVRSETRREGMDFYATWIRRERLAHG